MLLKVWMKHDLRLPYALENAIMTEKNSIPQAVMDKLKPLVGRYY